MQQKCNKNAFSMYGGAAGPQRGSRLCCLLGYCWEQVPKSKKIRKKAPEFFSCPMLFRGRPPRELLWTSRSFTAIAAAQQKNIELVRGLIMIRQKKEGMARRRRTGLISGTGVGETNEKRRRRRKLKGHSFWFFFNVTTRASFLFCQQYQAMDHHAAE
jgi:hypothetical protein